MNMRFYPPNPRRGPGPLFYRQRFGPPPRMRRQPDSFNYPDQFRRPADPNFYAEPFGRQYNNPANQNPGQDLPASTPSEQPRFSRLARLPDQFNTLMGHAGTIQNGINTMRQLGSLLRIFR